MSKPIVGALIVLAVLAGIWLVTDTSPYTGDVQKLSTTFAEFVGTDFSPAARITLVKGAGTVELEKKSGQWVVASSYGYPADEEKIEKILTALKGIPLRLVSQAASRRNITFVMRDADVSQSMNRLHAAFFGAKVVS